MAFLFVEGRDKTYFALCAVPKGLPSKIFVFRNKTEGEDCSESRKITHCKWSLRKLMLASKTDTVQDAIL